MTIRDAVLADAPALARIYAAAEGATRAGIGAGTVEAVDLAAWFAERVASCGIAEHAGEAVGFVELVAPDELRAIYVEPRCWGSGVADALHRRALDRLAAAGVDRAWLTVFASNGRARRFYERNGWCAVGEAEPQEFAGAMFAFVRYERQIR